MTHDVDITEFPAGRFRAMCRASGSFVISPDPEHDWCKMASVTKPDGPVQFYRDGIPSLGHSSMHRMGETRIEMGNSFPSRLRRRREFDRGAGGQHGGGHGDV